MKRVRQILMLLMVGFISINFTSCGLEDNGKDEIPKMFIEGDEIHFIRQESSDGYASYGFDWFISQGVAECQWLPSNEYEYEYKKHAYINSQYSWATYTYQVVNENEAKLTSRNYQAMTGRTWTVDITMFYETPTSGTYTSRERALSTGGSHTLSGRFEIN